MDIKVKRKYNRLDSLTPVIVKVNDENVDEIKIGEEKTIELPDEKAEVTISPVFEKVKPVPVKDGDIVLISRKMVHYILQFLALLLAITPGVLMAVNIESWPSLILFLPAVGIVFVIDFFIKTYQIEVTGNDKNN